MNNVNTPCDFVAWNDMLDAVVVQWSDHAQDSKFGVLGDALELTKTKGSRKVLFDIRHLDDYSEEDGQWASIHLYPGLLESGVRFVAKIFPGNILAKPYYHAVNISDDGVPAVVGCFCSLEEAMQWLYEVD
jgi:hypothetical protein